jgi:DNA-binding transcriptional MerR regulator
MIATTPQPKATPMPTEPPEAARRESWADWLPSTKTEQQGTLDELLAYLERLDVAGVTADNIRYWTKAGIIPVPTKRWHNGATRALYPITSAALAINELLELKGLGYSLEQIRTRLRAWVGSGRNPDPMGISEAITEVAHQYGRIQQNTITAVQIQFIDADGRKQGYHYDIPPDHANNNQR